ncbi:MAG: Re/Si-specific NAD(P)(+) transhydrogenase subunit alpha [Verrucomicrobiota bacterium]
MPVVFVPAEADARETRVALIPEYVQRLSNLGAEVKVESGLGLRAGFDDAAYKEAGASVIPGDLADSAAGEADIVIRIRKPSEAAIGQLKQGALHLSFLDPFNEKPLLDRFAAQGVSAVSMEMIPRTTLAQKMDALSSQANLVGYAAVITAADRLAKILPMLMTPAGTLSPARVFIIGCGVAGLQAIATAKRLGARVEAFDTRPVVEEQVKSLGAKFVKIDIGETGQTEQGYAKELTPEQIEKQKQGMAKVCASSDIVITTAKLFGRPAPKLLSKEMIAGMQRGSVVVDLAAETGGNVEGTVADEEIETENGVKIIGTSKLECTVPGHASQMLAANFYNLLEHFWDTENKTFAMKLEDEILKGCLMTHEGKIVHEKFKKTQKA